MVYIIAVLCVVIVALCAYGVVRLCQEEDKEDAWYPEEDESAVREREKEAHYRRNFWSYDGSEQQDWQA